MDRVFYVLGSIVLLLAILLGVVALEEQEIIYVTAAISLGVSGLLFLAIGKVIILLSEIRNALVAGLELEEDSNASGSLTAQKAERNANEAVNSVLATDQNVETIKGPSISAEKRYLPLEAKKSSIGWFLPVISVISVVLLALVVL